ncbi:hypothetical protein V6N11_046751 [Hibiscus sabdariffa]|uniref:Disease resistance N-terminal domain-containing protein n=2 Tax=Hibiscus sabdariffa TaxID=183260 RepID=A0ABR2C9M1_9ROSI
MESSHNLIDLQKLCNRAYFPVTITSGENANCNEISIHHMYVTTSALHLLQQLGLWWSFKGDLHDLQSIVTAIKAVLLAAEERYASSNLVKDHLEKLKDALYDADDLLDDIHTEALPKSLMSANNLTNQVAYGLKMGRKIKAIKVRLSSIQSEANMLNLAERNHHVETPFIARRRKDEIIGGR